MDRQIGSTIEEIVREVSSLRMQVSKEDAIDISDHLFQSFTPLMKIFAKQKNFFQASEVFTWAVRKVIQTEETIGVKFGNGVHKGACFYFLGFCNLMMYDVDGAYLAFAEAAKEDEMLPNQILARHQKGLPPAVKILLLDLSPDHFAYPIAKQIRETIVAWEKKYPQLARSTPTLMSVESALNKNKIPRESAIQMCYSFTKIFVLDLWIRRFARPTFLTIAEVGEAILRFARTVEDLVRLAKNLSRDVKIHNYCHDTWFSSEDWNVPNYQNDIKKLLNDFFTNSWNLSQDGRNLLFTLKVRNTLAHRIPNDAEIFKHYVEMILPISSSFGFICDQVSK